jgi:magnesium transporter
MVETRAYRKGALEAEGFPMAEVSDHLETPDTIVWVDLRGASKDELHELASELGLHELAVEDALEAHQRPKVDYYPTHLFLSCHAVRLDDDAATLAVTEVDAFVSERWIITVRKDDGCDLEAISARVARSPDLAAQGTGFILYALLDAVVDDYFNVVEAFDEYYDDVSDAIFSEHPIEPSRQRHWFQMRQALVKLHRLVGPMREAVSSLMRREHGVVAKELYPYFQDVYDHVLRASESADAMRDLVSTIVETNLSLRDYRQNQVMKKVTSWAAIIAVPTLVTGYYGMNVPYPGFNETWGVSVSLVVMLAASLGLYVTFKKKGWL